MGAAKRSQGNATRSRETVRRLASTVSRFANTVSRHAKWIGRIAACVDRLANVIRRLGVSIECVAKPIELLAKPIERLAYTLRRCVWHVCGVGKETQLERQQRSESELEMDSWIRCSGCGHALTRERARIDVEGKHVHTFVNPSGFEYTIRCFGEAPGCAGAGEESTFWSWFRGFAWRMAACGGCGAHVGWSFRREESVFWGLVADRITG